MKMSEALAEIDWMPTIREARGSVRGRGTTSKYMQKKVAERTLTTHYVGDLADQLESEKHDSNRNHYQALTVKGRVVR